MSNATTTAASEQTTAEAVEKTLNVYPLGVEGAPFPMTYTNDRGDRKLGVLEGKNGHLTVHSELPYAKMIGTAVRDMPTPGMLHLFKRGTEKRIPGQTNRVEAILGDPGAGKSFLAGLHARMRTERGAILFDCGGRDLSELLYETVLDKSGNENTFKALDKALAEGTLNKTSITKLKDAFGPAFTEENGVAAVDWNEAAKSRIDSEALEAKRKEIAKSVEEEFKTKLDFNAERDSNKPEWKAFEQQETIAVKELTAKADAKRDHALNVLNEVAEREGFSQGGGIGLKVIEGAMIRAWRENRPLICDEYNKAKPGTDDALQVVWQVFNGEMKEHTVKGGNGENFTFARDKTPDQFFVTITGNKTKDGVSTRSLSRSAIDRIKPEFIEPLTKEDWSHRISQKLTGLPVTTLHDANADFWDKHKPEFKEWLTEMRTMGLSESQKTNIPSWQFAMIQNADKVMAASEQLATFYDRWQQVLDIDSKLHTSTNTNISIPSTVKNEVDDPEYSREVTVGMRRMMDNIDQAIIVAPEASPTYESKGIDLKRDLSQPPEVAAQEPEDIEKQFGTRLEKVIFDNIVATTPEKPELRKWLLKQAKELNILEPQAEDAAKMAHTRLSARLNIDPELEKIPEGMEEVHSLLAQHVRQHFKSEDGMELSADDKDIISPTALASVLTHLENKQEIDRPTTRSSVLYLPNSNDEKAFDEPVSGVIGKGPSIHITEDFLTDKNLSEESIQLRTRLKNEEEGLNTDPLPTADLADAERFLISLAIPSIKGKNLEALWNKHGRSDEVANTESQPETDADQIIENRHSSGVSTQLVLTKSSDGQGGEKDEYLMVVHDAGGNNGKGMTLITGTTEISEKLQSALESQGVVYVNRDSADAEPKISSTLDKITAGKEQNPENKRVDYQPFSHVLLETFAFTLMNPRITGTIMNPDNQEVQVSQGLRYDLPNNELLFDYAPDENERASPEWSQKSKTNLVAMLADRDGYIEKNKGHNLPFVVTDSKDIDQLKHTLKALSNDGKQQSAGQSVG